MLVLNEVSKYYKNVHAVQEISFEVNKGEIFGLIGANGAGKSTTISMIATMFKPDKGDILFRGKSIVKNPKVIRPYLGYVPQDIALYQNLSGKDNLHFWGNAYHVPSKILPERIEEVCETIGFTDSMLKQQAGTYSGGMKRRLNLGAALLHRPELVILDEPTVGIDMITRNQILDSVKKLSSRGTTIIFTSHYLDEVERLCDTICILDKGNVITKGKKTDLLSEKESQSLEQLYYDLLGDGVLDNPT